MTRWRVHIGAHKTGTTHLQELLEANASRLAEAGVDVLKTRTLSPIVRRRTERRSLRAKHLVKRLISRSQNKNPYGQLQMMMLGLPTTVLSHEDQLGYTQDLLRQRLYDGSERLQVLESLPHTNSKDIFLSIRSFDTLFLSAFCEMLKPFYDARTRLKRRLQTIRTYPPSWCELAERIAARFPQDRVHVWKFEDYVEQPEFVIEALSGVSIGILEKRAVPMRTSSPSLRAIALAEELDPRLEVQERMQEVRKLFNEHPKQPGEKMDIISEADAIWLRDHYHRDLERICQSKRIHLLQSPQVRHS